MKLLSTLTAITCLTALTSVALAAETTAEAATESAADTSLSGILPAEQGPATATEATSDQEALPGSSAPTKGREAKNAIYADLLGPGLFYSLNYDRVITDDLSARIGFSYLSFGVSASDGAGTTASAGFSYWAVPLTVSYLGIGSENNMFEVGGGGAIMNITGSGLVESSAELNASVTMVAMTALAGYRHQPADGGFVFRIGLSPIMVLGYDVLPSGYLSLGAAF